MLNIAVVEDNFQDTETLRSYMEKFFSEHHIEYGVVYFESAIPFLAGYSADFDIVFMDIELPDLSGMDAAKMLRESDKNVILIFVTNMSNFAVKGYEVDALDFIVKPVAYFSFSIKLDRAVKRLGNRRNKDILISVKEGNVCLKDFDILYVEIMKHEITWHTVRQNYRGYGSLKEVEPLLSQKKFVRCNRCYIVNLQYVKQIRDFDVLVGEEWLAVSHARKKDFLRALNEYIRSVD